MKLVIVSASMRPKSASSRCARFLSDVAETVGFTDRTMIDLGENPLPLWDVELGDGADHWAPWLKIKTQLQAADAVILITPEWHGMATPAMKNFLLLSSQKELGHKAGLPVAVSAADNGVYPISELRMTGTKNNHLCLIPEQLVFRQVDDLINEQGECTSDNFADRCHYTLSLLHKYAEVLTDVRADERFPSSTHVFGM